MRVIGTLPTAAQARVFSDYLIAQGVRNEIEQDKGSWMIWVAAEEQLAKAQELFERFRRDPAAPEFSAAARKAEQVRETEAEELAAYRRRFFSRRQVFRRTSAFGAGVLTYVLIVASVVVTLLANFGKNADFALPLLISGYHRSAGFLPEVMAGQVWRLFTPVLLHGNWPHLIFNMLWLFQLGSMIEGAQGQLRFIIITIALAIGSNLVQYLWAGPLFYGMSGVVYGLFGYVWLRGKLDPASGVGIDAQNAILMMIWFVVCFTGKVGPIANGAHAGGLALGVAWGFISGMLARRR